MSKLSKAQIKRHSEACELLGRDALSIDEREFVLEHWQESATHINSAAGAFFTPLEMAWTFTVEVGFSRGEPCRIIDLCAGIGCLSYATYQRNWSGRPDEPGPEIVCVEKNADYVEVGRKVLPEATWICADVFDLPPDLGHFDFAISNPPFGKGGPISGVTLDLNVVAVAAELADWGVFILPKASAPFSYSGQPCYDDSPGAAYVRFHEKTGITLGPSCGIDCDYFIDQWRGVAPKVEVCIADFEEFRAAREARANAAASGADLPLFAEAAE